MKDPREIKLELKYFVDCTWEEFKVLDFSINLHGNRWFEYCETLFNRVNEEGIYLFDSAARRLDLIYWQKEDGEGQ